MPRRDCNGSRGCQSRAIRMDVAEWLRGLGLEQYTPAFHNNDIDDQVPAAADGRDLRELGVTSVGYRRRLLNAPLTLRSTRYLRLIAGSWNPSRHPLGEDRHAA